MTDENATLDFIVEVPAASATGTKGMFGPSERVAKHCKVPVAKLRESLTAVADGLSATLQDLKAVGGFTLTEITLEAEVNAEGGVSLLGTGATAGAKGAITLKFVQKGS